MKLTLPTNLRNSAKDSLILELTALLASYKVDRVIGHLTEDFTWTLVGDEPIVGREKFKAALEEMSGNKATELVIHSVATNGTHGAIHGEVTMESGSVYGFSDHYVFSNAAVSAITSYVILKKEPSANEDC